MPKEGSFGITVKRETGEKLAKERRLSETWDELIKRLFLGEKVGEGRILRVFVTDEIYEKLKAEGVMKGKQIAKIASWRLAKSVFREE